MTWSQWIPPEERDPRPLPDFLRDRYREHLAVANHIGGMADAPSWAVGPAMPDGTRTVTAADGERVVAVVDATWVHHITIWSPARVAAQAEANLLLVDLAVGCPTCGTRAPIPHACPGFRVQDALDLDNPADPWREALLRMVEPFSWHPDFRDEWRLT